MTLFATAVEAWFTSQTSGLVFGVSGALVGTLGGVFRIVGIRRIPRTAGMTILYLCHLLPRQLFKGQVFVVSNRRGRKCCGSGLACSLPND